MTCSHCGSDNPAGKKFCGDCGGALENRCPQCGAVNPPSKKFCGDCGAAFGAQPTRTAAVTEARKVVTIIFADLIGSTSLHERLDAESVTRLMESYYRAMRGAIESHDGTVVKLMGDGVMAAFGVPRVAEDDAIRAVRAGVAMQDAFRELANAELAAVGDIGLRVGINTGEVVVSVDNTDVVGDPVNVAARLQAEARDGEVVIGESTRRLVAARVTLAPLGSFALKGRAEAMKAYRVVSLERPTGVTTAAFVGRDDELARIAAVYAAACAKPAGHLAVLLGSPGLGKSRLIAEVTLRLGDAASVVTAHCDAAGGTTFAPVAAALRELFQIEAGTSMEAVQAAIEAAIPTADTERTRIAGGIAALLAGSPASAEETFFVIRRLLAGLAAAKPVVLVIDDLQWAESLLLDLVEHLVQWSSGVPLLVLVGARPELRDLRSSLTTPGGLVSDVVTLAGLDAGAAMRLAANVIGAADLPAAVAAKVLATSEGNPLFVGELVRMLVDEGAIERQGERWIVGANLAALEMPPTIHALLAARIERLRPEERTVLERAAVVGRHFSRSAVAALLGPGGSDLDARLEALRRSELIERDTGWFLGEPVLRFHHVLIRDAAYRRLLKGSRAELHERLADWIEAQVKDAPEHDETIGWHLEQAHQHRRELGPLDAKGRVLGERAAQRLAAAGRRALERDDLPLAASLLGRAIDRLDGDDASRADLALDWCEALLAAGDVGTAATAIDELARFLSDPRLAAWHACFAGQLTVLTAPEALRTTADTVAAAAEELASLGDAAGEAKGHFVHALALARLGKVGDCEAALDRALAAARHAGDRRRANTVLAIAPLAALWGPSPVTRASGRCLDVVRVLRITQGAPAVEAVALRCQAVLEALRGRADAARRMIGSARKLVEDLGITQRLLEADVFGGLIDLLEGDPAAAEHRLRRAYDGLRDLGLGIDAAQAAALLARALLAQDRGAEAEALSHESEALAGDDLKAAIAWRAVRAEALARRGEHAPAVALASKAVEIAAATDALLDHADARLALAAALRAAGRSGEADAEERRAIELWEAKGATLLVERTRTDGERAAPVTVTAEEPIVAPPAARQRLRPNAATAELYRFTGALAARDFDAAAACLSEDHEMVDHPTGSTYGKEAAMASLQRLFRSREPCYELEPLSTLGEFLVLLRRRTSASGAVSRDYDVGAYENETIGISEVDEWGLVRRAETFAADHLSAAIARLYERYAELLPEGPARTRAVATAHSFAAWLTVGSAASKAVEIAAATDALAPGIDMIDHRTLGLHNLRGAATMRDYLVAMDDLEQGVVRWDEFRCLPDMLLARYAKSGVVRASGGAFERQMYTLWQTDHDGSICHVELFDVEQEAEALARFDALAGDGAAESAEGRFANAASRADRKLFDCFHARDWPGIEAIAAPELVFDERRRLVRNTCGRDVWLEQFRILFDVPASRFTTQLLATRGEHLSLNLHCFTGEVAGGGGPLAMEDHLALHEVDRDGRIVAIVLFDLEDLDAAYAELDACFDAGEGAAQARTLAAWRRWEHAMAIRDWDAYSAMRSPGFVFRDHRLLGWGTTMSDGASVEQITKVLVDLAPDVHRRHDHVRLCERGILVHTTQAGTRDGGAFEKVFLAVYEWDAQGWHQAVDNYDVDRFDLARARFAELAAPAEATRGRFENAAMRTLKHLCAAAEARDLQRVALFLAADFRNYDRTSMAQIEADREQWLASVRHIIELTAGPLEPEILATRGERLVLERMRWHGASDDVGPSVIDWLMVLEVNDAGDVAVIVSLDPDDEGAAYAELDARYDVLEAALHPQVTAVRMAQRRAYLDRDWDVFAATYAPDLVCHDHRLLGWGTLRGVESFLRTQHVLFELAPDTRLRNKHMITSEHGFLWSALLFGTRDGGAFEIAALRVDEIDAAGKTCRIDLYDVDKVDEALARFAELDATTPRDPLAALATPNAASAAVEHLVAAFDAGVATGDWEAMRVLHAPHVTFDDRQRRSLVAGDRELTVASLRERGAAGLRPVFSLLGTAGDRIAVLRVLWSGGPPDGRFEIEHLALLEVDASGLFTAIILFDLEDRFAASVEGLARFAAGEAAGSAGIAPLHPFLRALRDRTWDAVRECFAPDLVFIDHRPLGFGALDREQWIASLRANDELCVGLIWEVCRVLVWNEQGFVNGVRRLGTIADGGGPFENEFFGTFLVIGGRIQRYEVFTEAERALACFAELCAARAT